MLFFRPARVPARGRGADFVRLTAVFGLSVNAVGSTVGDDVAAVAMVSVSCRVGAVCRVDESRKGIKKNAVEAIIRTLPTVSSRFWRGERTGRWRGGAFPSASNGTAINQLRVSLSMHPDNTNGRPALPPITEIAKSLTSLSDVAPELASVLRYVIHTGARRALLQQGTAAAHSVSTDDSRFEWIPPPSRVFHLDP